jgi:hypothetical protein
MHAVKGKNAFTAGCNLLSEFFIEKELRISNPKPESDITDTREN